MSKVWGLTGSPSTINETSGFIKADHNIRCNIQDGADIATLREGIKLSRRIAESQPLGKYLNAEAYPGSGRNGDADLEEFIRKTAHSGNALVGTCRLGVSAEDGSVVSSESFQVHGVDGLRVVDSSVIPVIPGGQTGAPTVMIAERAAAAIVSSKRRVAAGAMA